MDESLWPGTFKFHAFFAIKYREIIVKKNGSWALGVVVAGLTAFAAPAYASSNLVTNGGFEVGDFSGWTQSGDSDFNAVQCAGGYEGRCGALFGSVLSSSIEQTINFGSAGQQWQLSFALQSDGGDENGFSVQFGGQTLLSLSNQPAGNYTLYQFSGVAMAETSTLVFSFYNPTAYLNLDAVSVTAVPEPATMGLMGAGLMGLLLARRRKAA